MNRRFFLRTTTATTFAGLTTWLARPVWALQDKTDYVKTIGLQLWTVRNQIQKDAKATLKSIADAGYYQVEFGDVQQGIELMPICKDLGLNANSSFLNWLSICDPKAEGVPKLDKILEQAKKLNLKHLVFGYIGQQFRKTKDQYKKYIESANQFGEKCKKAGIQLCYHNHSFEFEKIDEEKTGFDLFMEGFEKDLCKFELDVFWAKIGGWDPIETLKKLDGRVSQVHLKDIKLGTELCYQEGKVPHDAFQELGDGTIDMKQVLEVSKSIGVEQCHVEQDQSPDPIASIGQSMKHLKTF